MLAITLIESFASFLCVSGALASPAKIEIAAEVQTMHPVPDRVVAFGGVLNLH